MYHLTIFSAKKKIVTIDIIMGYANDSSRYACRLSSRSGEFLFGTVSKLAGNVGGNDSRKVDVKGRAHRHSESSGGFFFLGSGWVLRPAAPGYKDAPVRGSGLPLARFPRFSPDT